MHTLKEQKEIELIYRKHNKSTDYKLEIEESRFSFPESVRQIINKKEKRTKAEADELNQFRKKILSELAEESKKREQMIKLAALEKRKERAKKSRMNRDKRNQCDPTKEKHFGIWITLDSKSRISRDHYAEINKKSSLSTPQTAEYYRKHPAKRSEIFEDENCTIYTDLVCEQYKAKCLENFDKNMRYFDSLDPDEFQKEVLRLIVSRKDINQVFDLYDYAGIQGVYILVLRTEGGLCLRWRTALVLFKSNENLSERLQALGDRRLLRV